MQTDEHTYPRRLAVLLGVLSIFRILYIIYGPFELSADEAHYWTWSRHLDWSYYSKGPMIAWLIYASTQLFGNNEFGVRAFAVVCSALSSIILFRLGREMYDGKTGFWAAVLVQIVPLYAVFGIFFSIDSPYIFFWILSLFLFWKAYRAETEATGEQKAVVWWVLLGLSAGLGMLTKYTMALFYFSALLFMLFDRNARRLWFKKGPYISMVISLIVFSPVIYWNAKHDWVTVKHTAGQAHMGDGLRISLHSIIDYLGSQLGAVTPVLLVLMLIASWKMRKEDKGSLLFWFMVPTLAFFGLKSIQGTVQGNWAIAGYAAGFIPVSHYYLKNIASMHGKKRRLIISAPLVALLVTTLAYFPLVIPLPPEKHPVRKLMEGRDVGRRMSAIYKEMSAEGPVFVMSDTYQQSSLLSFYMEGNPPTYCLWIGRRMTQFDIWSGFQKLVGQNVLFTRINEHNAESTTRLGNISAYLGAAFDHCERQDIDIQTRMELTTYAVFRCYAYNGLEPARDTTY